MLPNCYLCARSWSFFPPMRSRIAEKLCGMSYDVQRPLERELVVSLGLLAGRIHHTGSLSLPEAADESVTIRVQLPKILCRFIPTSHFRPQILLHF